MASTDELVDQALEEGILEESQEIFRLIAEVTASQGQAAERVYERYKHILGKYQEQPQLLDSCLEGIVQPLAVLLRRAALDPTLSSSNTTSSSSVASSNTSTIQGVCRLLHVLVTVRGHKTVVKFFPHEATDLERVLQVLQLVRDTGSVTSSSSTHAVTAAAPAAAAATARPAIAPAEQQKLWETQSVLLLWLSILILIPFDLATVDSEATEVPQQQQQQGQQQQQQHAFTPLAGRVMELCQQYLDHPGMPREMAALLLGRLLTRPDMAPALQAFLAWEQSALATVDGSKAPFLVPGILQTLGHLFKLGQRQRLLPVAPTVWTQLSGLMDQGSSGGVLAGAAVARKLATKLATRVGLVFLVPRLAPWRYVRGMADISGALAGTRAEPEASSSAHPSEPAQPSESTQPLECEPEIELAEEVEEVMGCLLQSLRDRDTIVRWSAAKGVGRLTGSLPLELGEDVVDNVLELFGPTEGDAPWHGGCLALAELARRGLLLPGRLPAITPIIASALEYDVRRGPHSIGAHVRDAAAYVCWAFARAYAPELLAPSAQLLGGCLMAAACYDREVNCRRAAASAYQECVGRLGVLPHGIEVLAVADFFSVGNITEAYLKVAPAVAAYPEYLPHLTRHLLSLKLRHWDRPLRSLAAKGLAALVPADPGHFATAVLDELLPQCADPVLEVRLGAVLGVAELLPALAAAGQVLSANRQEAVAQLLQQFDASRAYRGKGGELMRDAAARLLERMAVAQLTATASANAAVDGRTAPAASEAAAPAAAVAAAAPAAGEGQSMVEWRLPLSEAQHQAALTLLDDCLRHVLEGTRGAGCAALAAYARAYGPKALNPAGPHPDDGPSCTQAGATGVTARNADVPGTVADAPSAVAAAGLQKLVDTCLARLNPGPTEPHVRRGAATALGVLPKSLAAPRADELVTALVAAASVSEGTGSKDEGLGSKEEVDVESRMHAVRSLGQLCQELFEGVGSSSTGSRDSEPAGSYGAARQATKASANGETSAIIQEIATPSVTPAAQTPAETAAAAAATPAADADAYKAAARAAWSLMARHVLPCLLHAMGDYTTDNRGDVGSWVREAAMEELPGSCVLLRRLEVVAGGPEQGRAGHAGLAAAGVGWLLRQALERIARVREAAMRQLRRMLEHPELSADIPRAPQLLAALPSDATLVTGVASLDSIQAMGALLALPLPDYQAPLLEGLVASIGCVDASLAREAGTALLRVLPSEGGRNVGALLLLLWEREARSARLATPLIRTCHLLLTKAEPALLDLPTAAASASMPDQQPEPIDSTTSAASQQLCTAADTAAGTSAGVNAAGANCSGAAETPAAAAAAETTAAAVGAAAPVSFAAGVLALLKGELRQCGDVVRLLEGATLAAHLVGMAGCREPAMQSILVLLVNRFPKVRRHTAEQLYLVLLSEEAEDEGDEEEADGTPGQHLEPGMPNAEAREAALDLLLSTPWDGPLEGARGGRDELASLLGLQVKSKPAVNRKRHEAAAGNGRDENASYQSLLDDAARGGGY